MSDAVLYGVILLVTFFLAGAGEGATFFSSTAGVGVAGLDVNWNFGISISRSLFRWGTLDTSDSACFGESDFYLLNFAGVCLKSLDDFSKGD